MKTLKCRACLAESESTDTFISISLNLKLSNDTVLSVEECARRLMKLEYRQDDNGLPQSVCLTCAMFLTKMWKFIENCKSSDKILREQLEEQISVEGVRHEMDKDFLQQEEETVDNCTVIILENDSTNKSTNSMFMDEEISIIHGPEDEFPEEDDGLSENAKCISDIPSDDEVWNNLTDDDNDNMLNPSKPMESQLQCSVHGATYWKNYMNGTLNTSEFFEKNPSKFCTCFVDFYGNDNPDIDCPFCEVKFRTPQAFISHRVKVHKDKTAEWTKIRDTRRKLNFGMCHICGVIKRRHYLQTHLKICEGKHECASCGKKFLNESILELHQAKHIKSDEITLYHCDECGKMFTNRANLKWHIMKHLGQYNYECSVCNKKFIYPNNYKNHIKTHNTAKSETKFHVNSTTTSVTNKIKSEPTTCK